MAILGQIHKVAFLAGAIPCLAETLRLYPNVSRCKREVPMRKPAVQPESPDETEVDRLLGKRALFKMAEVRAMGGPSVPTLHRAARAGLIKVVRNGSSSDLTRATVKRILLEGLGPISFLYGKGGEKSA